MRSNQLLTAFLLGVGLCLAPALGHGEIKEWVFKEKVWNINFELLRARINYIMRNPDTFLEVDFQYTILDEPHGIPEDVDTIGKIIVTISDSRNKFLNESSVALRNEFKGTLEILYTYIKHIAEDMDDDIVAVL